VAHLKKNGKLPANEIYKAVVQAHGYYSRQSLYNALKDEKTFKKVGEDYMVAGGAASATATSDEEAETFVKAVEGESATSSVV